MRYPPQGLPSFSHLRGPAWLRKARVGAKSVDAATQYDN
jgi:hypothetical protein